jgi:hypothetical protein
MAEYVDSVPDDAHRVPGMETDQTDNEYYVKFGPRSAHLYTVLGESGMIKITRFLEAARPV